MTRHRIWQIVVFALIIINVAEAGVLFTLSRRDRLYSYQAQFPVFQGITPRGALISEQKAACYVVRLTSKGCSFCRQDMTEYAGILNQARQSHCQAFVLSPRADGLSDQDIDTDTTPVSYVSYAVGGALIPVLTPETFLLNANHQLIWESDGAISPIGEAEALRLLRKSQP